MNRFRFLVWTAPWAVALLVVPGPLKAADPPGTQIDLDELAPHPDFEWLRRAKVPTDDAGLVKFLNGLRGPEADPGDVRRLVDQLRTGTAVQQDAAAARLAEIGPAAIPVLRRYRLGPDPMAATRVRACLARIEEAHDQPLARPVMRRLVRRNDPGAAAALLGYVPFAFDPEAELDAWYGLDGLAGKDPKVLSLLAGALADRQPARRAVAACILGRRGDAAHKKAVAGLLKDPDPEVRLRAAQGLLVGKNPAGVPTLIDLLTDPAVEVRWQAEELLRWLAVDTAPDRVVGADTGKAAACQAAWRKWWTDRGQKADVAAAEAEPRRPLLLLAYDRKGGRAWVVGCDGVTRHEWKMKPWLADAQYVPGGGILTLHEQLADTKPVLAERNLVGEALWQHTEMIDPQYIQRLSNGHVFVAEFELAKRFPRLRYQILGPGPRVIATQPAASMVQTRAVRQSPDGKVVCADIWNPAPLELRLSHLREYDPDTNGFRWLGGGAGLIGDKYYVESAPDGGHLVSGLNEPREGRPVGALEFDYFGDVVWKYLLAGVTHADRLRGGTTIACTSHRFVELTPDRRMVGEVTVSSGPDVARPMASLARFGFDQFPADADLEVDIEYRVRSLSRKDSHARLWALRQLAAFDPAAAGVIPKLQAHRDPDPAVREALQKTLLALGEKEISRLTAEAKQSDADGRFKAIADLRKYAHNPVALDALVAALSDENPKVRAFATTGVAWGSRPDPQGRLTASGASNPSSYAVERAVPALIKLIATDRDATVRAWAIHALATFGEAAKRAAPLLISLVKDGQETVEVRCNALTGLGRIANGDEDALNALYGALADMSVSLRLAAAQTLVAFQSPAKDKVQRLLAAYPQRKQGENSDVKWLRSVVLSAVRKLQPDRSEVGELFLSLAEDPSTSLEERIEAAEYLFETGKREAAAKYLAKWLAEGDRQQQSAVRKAIYQLRRAASIARWNDE